MDTLASMLISRTGSAISAICESNGDKSLFADGLFDVLVSKDSWPWFAACLLKILWLSNLHVMHISFAAVSLSKARNQSELRLELSMLNLWFQLEFRWYCSTWMWQRLSNGCILDPSFRYVTWKWDMKNRNTGTEYVCVQKALNILELFTMSRALQVVSGYYRKLYLSLSGTQDFSTRPKCHLPSNPNLCHFPTFPSSKIHRM